MVVVISILSGEVFEEVGFDDFGVVVRVDWYSVWEVEGDRLYSFFLIKWEVKCYVGF